MIKPEDTKRINGEPWAPWETERYLPLQGLIDPSEEVVLIEEDWLNRRLDNLVTEMNKEFSLG